MVSELGPPTLRRELASHALASHADLLLAWHALYATDKMSIESLHWLKRVSFLNYAYDGLAVNELLGLQIKDFAVRAIQGCGARVRVVGDARGT